MTRRRLLLGGGLVAIVIAVAAGLYVRSQDDPVEKRGSATEEFVTTEEPEQKPPPKKDDPRPWPTYGYDNERSHVSPYNHRPPYKRLWSIDAHDTVEFPASVGYGRVYVAQQKGLFFALNAKTGRVSWRKSFGRCAAASPTVGKGLVYQSYMHRVVCAQGQAGADGFVIAWDAQTGRERWRYEGAPFESSPLLHGNRLYVGSWDHGVHAINAKTGKRIWRFQADNEVNTSAAYWKRRIFIASDSGTLYSLNAKTGKLIWTGQQRAHEFFYATPTIAYGRVYIGSTDGTMYVYGAKSGRLLWARPLGSYIYGAAAVYKRKVFVGTYDGKFYALDAATGDVRWQIDAHGAVHGGADGYERAGLLRGLLELRLGGAALGGPRAGRHLRRASARRQAGVELPGRQVREPGGGRQGAHVPHGTGRAVRVRQAGLQGGQGLPSTRS